MSDSQGPSGAGQAKQGSNHALKGVAFLTIIFMVNFLSRISLPPLFPVMEMELGFNHTQAGSIFMFGSLGYCVGLFTSGWLAVRLNHRSNILLSIVVLGIAMVLVTIAQSLNGLRAAFMMAGVGGGLYLPSGVASVTSLVPRHKFGWALGIHEMAPNLSFITVPLLAELMLGTLGWRGAPGLLALVAAVLGLAFWKYGKASEAKGQPLNLAMLSEILSSRTLWLAALGLMVAVGTSLGSFSMLPLFLVVEHGFDQTSVNVLLALSRVACLFTAFSAGMLSDRMGAFKALSIFMCLTGVLTILLGQASGYWVWVLLFVQPAVAVCMFAPIFTFISLSMPPQTRSLGVSMVTTCATLFGAGLMPIGLGYMGEMGRFGTGFSIMGCLILVGVVVLYYLGRNSEIARD